jgi:hypothetical protein
VEARYRRTSRPCSRSVKGERRSHCRQVCFPRAAIYQTLMYPSSLPRNIIVLPVAGSSRVDPPKRRREEEDEEDAGDATQAPPMPSAKRARLAGTAPRPCSPSQSGNTVRQVSTPLAEPLPTVAPPLEQTQRQATIARIPGLSTAVVQGAHPEVTEAVAAAEAPRLRRSERLQSRPPSQPPAPRRTRKT